MAHVVMPARRSAVPGEWVRRCSNPECGWTAYDRDLERLAELATAHHVDPVPLSGGGYGPERTPR